MKRRPNKKWTADETALFSAMWLSGKPYKEIEVKFGILRYQAVTKVRSMGLPIRKNGRPSRYEVAMPRDWKGLRAFLKEHDPEEYERIRERNRERDRKRRMKIKMRKEANNET